MWMKRAALLGVVLGVSCFAGGAEQGGWEPKKAAVMTKWAAEVSPDKVLPEYPRPQMVREKWVNLNGVWEMEEGKEAKPAFGKALKGKILVPFPVESALSGIMKQMDLVTYRRTFKVPGDWAGQRVILHFGAVDWESVVYVNGKEMGMHRGGYDPFSYDITDALKKDGDNEIIVTVFDPSDAGEQPRGKQVKEPRGIWYTPVTGIWQTVWIEPVPQKYVKDVRIVPDVDKSEVTITIDGVDDAEVTVLDRGNFVGTGKGKEVKIPVSGAKLWSPDSPNLYDVTIKAGDDSVKTYFGMRKIEIGKDEKGVTRLLLNGKFVFQVGMLDQGFWPDGIYTAPTDEALKFDIEQQKKLGFNMIRKHVKVEPQRWYYWADKLGVLVWQDMPSAGDKGAEKKEGTKAQFETELTQMVKTHWNHPSIIMWVVFNEGWGQYETPRIVELTRKLDSTRLINNASGWTDANVGDVMDIHVYPGPGSPKPEEKRAAVLGEFGGLGLQIEGKEWKGVRPFSYSGMADKDELVAQYTRLLSKCWQLKDSDGLSAIVYTQTTDVEGEINGLMSYDRVMKHDEEKFKLANTGQGPFIEMVTVVPSAEKEGVTWRYTTEKPTGADLAWAKKAFDDSKWKEGQAGFGSDGVTTAKVRTKWDGEDIWLRREIELPADGDLSTLRLWMYHDDGCEVYLNGVLAKSRRRAISGYEEQPINKDALASLKPGKNTLAVHTKNTGGPGCVDVGLVRVIEHKDRTASGAKR